MPPTPAHTTSGGSPFFVRWLPRVLTILALLMLLQLITPEARGCSERSSSSGCGSSPSPRSTSSPRSSSSCSRRLSFRKRLAWWILLALLVVIIALIGLVIVVAYLVSPDILGWDLATSLVLPIAGIIGLLVYRRWYIAKTQPRGFLKAIAVLIAGLVLTVIIVLTAQYIIGGLTMIEPGISSPSSSGSRRTPNRAGCSRSSASAPV